MCGTPDLSLMPCVMVSRGSFACTAGVASHRKTMHGSAKMFACSTTSIKGAVVSWIGNLPTVIKSLQPGTYVISL